MLLRYPFALRLPISVDLLFNVLEEHTDMAEEIKEGVTESEQLLSRLCRHSFLTLWGYSNLYNNKGDANRGGDGDELCDFLVVFGDDVILFSDKDCAFPDTSDLDVDWSRWYKKAILKSANQIYGAERWIKMHPNRVFVDKRCTQPLPFPLPSSDKMRVHRVVVAHGAGERIKAHFGDSGSLLLDSNLEDDAHYHKESERYVPFTVGHVNRAKGFVHVFDDETLPILMQELDTVRDFIEYLSKKESLFCSSRKTATTGEEELLAYYITRTNEQGDHDFTGMDKYAGIYIDQGFWAEYQDNPQRIAKHELNNDSYAWDYLIEHFIDTRGAYEISGMSYPDTQGFEAALRFMAAENRVSRRGIADALLSLMKHTPSMKRATRIVMAHQANESNYLFMVFPVIARKDEEEQRQVRAEILFMHCNVAMLHYPNIQHLVGLATESGLDAGRSWDFLYQNRDDWTTQNTEKAEEMEKTMRENQLLGRRTAFLQHVQEYPDLDLKGRIVKHESTVSRMTGNNRNAACPCGSGKKFKRCCGFPR